MTANALSPLVRRWSPRVTPMTRLGWPACVLGTPESVPVLRRRSQQRHGGGIRMRSR
jgi:hypothetical protein